MELLDISSFDVPSVWKSNADDISDNVKKCLVALNVTLDDSMEDESIILYYNKCLQAIQFFENNPSFSNSDKVFSLFENVGRNQEAKFCLLYKALKPEISWIPSISGESSELTNTSTLYANLFDLASVFPNYHRSGNQEIRNLLYGKTEVNKFLEEIKPDDVLARKYGDISCLRFAREDKPGVFQNHLGHPDFLKLVLEMRLSLDYSIRGLVRGKLTPSHNNIQVIGATTDSNKTNLYKLGANISKSENAATDYSITYHLQYLGSYGHIVSDTALLKDMYSRKELIAKLLCYMFDPCYEPICKYVAENRASSTLSCGVKATKPTLQVSLENKLFSFYEKTIIRIGKEKSIKTGIIQDNTGERSLKVVLKEYFGENKEKIIADIRKTMLQLCIGVNHGRTLILVEGKYDLQSLNNSLSEKDAIKVLIDVCIQLEILSKLEILHNDIKPKNIIFYEGYWHLIDFEMSFKYDGLKDEYCLDWGEYVINKNGTEGYNAPEKEKNGYVSPKSDIYSLGISLDYLLSNQCENFESSEEIESDLFEENEEAFDYELKSNNNHQLDSLLKGMTKYHCKTRYSSTECIEELKKFGHLESEIVKNSKAYFVDSQRFCRMVTKK